MITTNRNAPIVAHVTPSVRAAIRDYAKRKRTSVSKLVHEFLIEKLTSKGYINLEDEK